MTDNQEFQWFRQPEAAAFVNERLDQFVAALRNIEEFDTLDRLATWDPDRSNIYH